MADYDLSKPAPDRSHRTPAAGTGAGGLGFVLVGTVVVLVVLYAVFGGAGVPLEQDPSAVVPEASAPAVDTDVAPAPAVPVPSE